MTDSRGEPGIDFTTAAMQPPEWQVYRNATHAGSSWTLLQCKVSRDDQFGQRRWFYLADIVHMRCRTDTNYHRLHLVVHIPLGCANEARIFRPFRTTGFDTKGAFMSRNDSKQLYDPARAVIAAAYQGCVKTATALLGEGADVNAHDCDGDTALMLAAERGHTEFVKLLLKNGANVNAENHNGESALMRAAANDRLAAVKILLAHHAHGDAGDVFGTTPLMRAAYHGHVDIVTELLACGAAANARNAFGNTAAVLAARNGHGEVESLLRDAREIGFVDLAQPKLLAARR
jgi:uncharacterized protein